MAHDHHHRGPPPWTNTLNPADEPNPTEGDQHAATDDARGDPARRGVPRGQRCGQCLGPVRQLPGRSGDRGHERGRRRVRAQPLASGRLVPIRAVALFRATDAALGYLATIRTPSRSRPGRCLITFTANPERLSTVLEAIERDDSFPVNSAANGIHRYGTTRTLSLVVRS
ncbi:MAG TPA: hypothetical protein VH092_30730 [Urbifossiella sp.]|nr:hypothetical protein [Urbifossiella sp.]